jgi:hypothetical protein
MHADDFEAMAHDLYEFHLYEEIRAKHPHLSPEEIAAGVIEIIGWDTNESAR